MYIEKVKLRLKGFAASYELEPLIAIVGPSRSGKTTLRQAIEIVGLGTSHRLPKSEWGKDPSVAVKMSDGSGLEIGSKGKLPILLFEDRLSFTSQRTQERILKRFGSGWGETLRTPEDSSEAEARVWDRIVRSLPDGIDGESALAQLSEIVRREKPILTRMLDAAQAEADEARAASTDASQTAPSKAELDKARKDLQAASAKPAGKAGPNFSDPRLTWATVRRDFLRASLDEYRRRTRNQPDLVPLTCPICTATTNVVQQLETADEKIKDIRAGITSSGVVPDNSGDDQRFALEDRIRSLEAAIRSSERSADLRSRASQLAAKAKTLAEERKAIDALGDVIAKRRQKLVKESIDACLAAVRANLSESFSVDYDIEKGWVAIDPKTERRANPGSMAGAEYAAINLALNLTFMEVADPKTAIVILDDEQFTGYSVALAQAVLSRLEELVNAGQLAQVIVLRQDDRADDIPRSWPMIKLKAAR